MDYKKRLVQMSEGVLIEQDTLRIAQKIKEYDDRLIIKYLNPNNPNTVSDAPYAIFELCPDGIERQVFSVWELDDRVLERLRAADSVSNNILAGIDANNASVTASLKRRYQEKNLELVDMMAHAFKSPKGRYSFEVDDKLISIDDDPTRVSTVTEIS